MPKSADASRFALLTGIIILGMVTLWQGEPRVARLWLNTVWLALGASLIAVPFGTLAAVAICKTDVMGRNFAATVFTGMLFVPLYVVTGAWDAGFGLQGWHTLSTDPHLAHEPWLHGWRAAIWVHAFAAVPWVVLIVGAALRAVEAEIEEDAATCASPPRVIQHITLRRIAPAPLVACVWVAITASVEISVTDFFQVRTFAEEVYTQAALGMGTLVGPMIGEESAFPLPAGGLWIGLLLSTLLALLAITSVSYLFVQLGDASHRRPWKWQLGRWQTPAVMMLWSILLLVAGVPLANLIYKAGVYVTATNSGHIRGWSATKVVERVIAAPREFAGELELSAAIGAAAASAAILVALPLAWSLSTVRRDGRQASLNTRRGWSLPWLRLGSLALCLTIPGPLLGIALIHALNRPPDSVLAPLAVLYDSNFAPWLAQTIRALPLVTLILWPALASIPQNVLDSAATEGAGWWRRLLFIAMPQRWSAVLAAWLVGFAIAVGEVAATVLVIPPQPSTAISVRVFQLLHYGVDDRVAAICLVLVGGIALVTAIAATLLKRTM
jgi:iron(III) transport system permease protein